MSRCGSCLHMVMGMAAHCRRLPPTYHGEKDDVSFPLVREDWWCGEHHFSLRTWLRTTWRNWRIRKDDDARVS